MKIQAALAVAFVLAQTPLAVAADLLVPSMYSSIQGAVNAAVDGDRVVLAPGTYNEQVTIDNKSITITSSGGPGVTKIDRAGAGGVVFNFAGFSAGRSAWISGLTISRCNDNAIIMAGGTLSLADVRVLSGSRGVFVATASSRIEALRYQAVLMSSPGAGAYLVPGSSGHFEGCAFANCNSHEGAAVFGESGNQVNLVSCSFSNCQNVAGTIRLDGASDLIATGCVWTGCTAGSISCAYIRGSTTASFSNCQFLDNAATDIWSSSSGLVRVQDSVQTGGRGARHSFAYTGSGPFEILRVNSRDAGGFIDQNQMGGWMLSEGGRVLMQDCSFTNFSCSGNGAYYGGVLRAYGSSDSVVVERCTFAINDSEGGNQSAFRVEGRPVSIRDCQFAATTSTYFHSPVRAISCPSVVVDRCAFNANRVDRGIWAENVSALEVRDSQFRKLNYEWNNHFIYMNGSSVRSASLIERCTFARGAYAVYRDGATADSTLEVRACFFQESVGVPSAIYSASIPVSVYDCCFRSSQFPSISLGGGLAAFLGGNYFCGSQVQELGPMPVIVKSPNIFSGDCSLDCDGDGMPNQFEISAGFDTDCDSNGIPDSCDASGGGPDCNDNGVPDACDVAAGAPDCDENGVLDSCQPDCDSDGVPDTCEIAAGATDCNANAIPDSCEPDCDADGILDTCEIAAGAVDCDLNGVPDICQIAANSMADSNTDGTLDSCQPDMQFAGLQLEITPIVNRGTDDLFPAGAVCYRLYARLSDPAAAVVGLYGNAQYPMVLNAIGGFWQSPRGGDFSDEVACDDPKALPSYKYDSWFGIGLDCDDGNATQSIGVDLGGFNSGGGVSDNDGIVFVVPGSPQSVGGSVRRVLLAQLTTTQPVFPTGRVNVVGRSSFGVGEAHSWRAYSQQIPMPALVDCNGNGEHDAFDIARGTSLDCDQSGVPDTCEHATAVTDCNSNGVSDLCDVYSGYSSDLNTNNVPDECECSGDVDANGRVDADDIVWVLVSWGDGADSVADVNSDGIVNGGDLAVVLSGWGNCL